MTAKQVNKQHNNFNSPRALKNVIETDEILIKKNEPLLSTERP